MSRAPLAGAEPRRGDDIVVEYQRELFDELRLDPRGFLYASEDNPFEVYRQVRAAILHYNDVFKLLGGCKVALSALSSKLMSLGLLLVAYELKRAAYNIGVAHIECQGYSLPAGAPARPPGTLHPVALRGALCAVTTRSASGANRGRRSSGPGWSPSTLWCRRRPDPATGSAARAGMSWPSSPTSAGRRSRSPGWLLVPPPTASGQS